MRSDGHTQLPLLQAYRSRKDYHGKRSRTAGLRCERALAHTLTLLLCFTISSSALAAQQRTSEDLCRTEFGSKEVDQCGKRSASLREDLKRLHALLESACHKDLKASAPTRQPGEALQPQLRHGRF